MVSCRWLAVVGDSESLSSFLPPHGVAEVVFGDDVGKLFQTFGQGGAGSTDSGVQLSGIRSEIGQAKGAKVGKEPVRLLFFQNPGI